MQAAKPLRKEGIKEKGHTRKGEQIRICRLLSKTEGYDGTFFADANA